MGSLAFARLIAELVLTSNALYCGLALLLASHWPALGWPLMRACAVGFSGVLFGLKVGEVWVVWVVWLVMGGYCM